MNKPSKRVIDYYQKATKLLYAELKLKPKGNGFVVVQRYPTGNFQVLPEVFSSMDLASRAAWIYAVKTYSHAFGGQSIGR